MMITMMKSKLHRASITQCELDYEGSVTIAEDLMEQANILPNEQVDIYNVNNGQRWTTYAIVGEKGSGIIGVNGPGARLAQVGDLVVIVCYGHYDEQEAKKHDPAIVLLNKDNTIKQKMTHK